VRGDAKVADPGVVRQDGVEYRHCLAGAGALVEDVRDRGRAGRAAGERFGDGAIELGGAVAVE
jgi:hypothetical protein